MSRLTDPDAFYLEHRYGGEVTKEFLEHEPYLLGRACSCGARVARLVQGGKFLGRVRPTRRARLGTPIHRPLTANAQERARRWRKLARGRKQSENSELLVIAGNSYHIAASHAERGAKVTVEFTGRRGAA